MISDFTLKFGRAPGLPPERITAAAVTVFVGPNNSGKSKFLSELANYCRSGRKNTTDVILDNVSFAGLAPDRALEAIQHMKQPPIPGETINVNHIVVGSRGNRIQVPLQDLMNFVENPSAGPQQFSQWFLRYSTLMLNGSNRIELINDQGAGDLQQPPTSSLQLLFQDDAKRREVRRIVEEAFG
jgi:hypothetical protein